jgi:hypothetical protein
MAGDITGKGSLSSTALTVTNLHSLASSQDWLTGWGSVAIDRSTFLDMSVGITFTTHASNRQAGSINVYVVGSLNATPTYPAVSSGTLGTEGAIAFTDTEERDAACRLLASITVDNTASAIVVLPATAIAALFNGVLPPSFVIFIAQNASTTTTAGLAAAGSAVYTTPFYGAYT